MWDKLIALLGRLQVRLTLGDLTGLASFLTAVTALYHAVTAKRIGRHAQRVIAPIVPLIPEIVKITQKDNKEVTPMNVRAKFHCSSKTTTVDYQKKLLYSYKFYPVTSGSEENKSFFASTPSGSLELSSVKDDLFEIGTEYYLDFTAAPVPAPQQEKEG